MGLTGSKVMIARRKIDEATSNSSLSNLRYIINTDKSKWKVFRKREVVPIPTYPASLKPVKGCPCGNNGPCKQKITPKGVTIHYPQKKSRFAKFGASKGYLPPKKETVYRARTIRQVAHLRLDKASILYFVTAIPVIIKVEVLL